MFKSSPPLNNSVEAEQGGPVSVSYQIHPCASIANTDTIQILQKSAPWKCQHLLESLDGECGRKDSEASACYYH